MKAVRFHTHGGPEVLRYEDAPDPVPGRDEALIRVNACALNHLDIWVQQGGPAYKVKLPHISGSDVSGVVESLDPVRSYDVAVVGGGTAAPPWLKPGAPVVVAPGLTCGRCEFCLAGEDSVCERFRIVGAAGDGGYAEKVVVPIRILFPKPEHLTFEQAAAFPLTFLTAWHMLIGRAAIQPSEDLLVLGAGSGVGSAAIQIGKVCGARVIATAGSEAKLEKAKQLGADETINHSKQKIADEVKRLTDRRGVDVVFEHVGTATWDASLASLAAGGRLVTCGATTGFEGKIDIRYLFSRQLSILGSYMGSKAELYAVLRLIGQRKLRAVIDRTMPLAQCAHAHELLESREQFGKIVLNP